MTVYALIVTFFLGALIRHNLKEFHTAYKGSKEHRKFVSEMNLAKKKLEEQTELDPPRPY